MNGVRLDQIRYVRLNQIHVPESDQIADRSAAHGCFFFLSFFPFYLSAPIASFSASRIFLNSEFRTLSSREMARVDNN